MTKPLIGLLGLKQSGKSSAARVLHLDYGYTELAMADPLRDFTAASDPIVGHELDGPYKVRAIHFREATEALGYEGAKARYPEYRRILQTIGTEGMRYTIGRDYKLREELGGLDVWEAIAANRIAASLDYIEAQSWGGEVYRWSSPLVFTDIRFPGEANLIRESGGVLIRVIRPGQEATDTHDSETLLADYEVQHELINGGTLADLARGVDAIMGNYA